MGAELERHGYFSLLKWRGDTARDEPKNVAVIVIDAEGTFGRVRSAPIGTISKSLHEQGLLDSVVNSLEDRCEAADIPTLPDLRKISEDMRGSLIITDPEPVAMHNVNRAVDELYSVYVAPRYAPSDSSAKFRVLDRTMKILRRRGLNVRRGGYVEDFIFDVIVEADVTRVGEVFSFALTKSDWAPVEHQAGHFLFGLEHLRPTGVAGFVVIQPPTDRSPDVAHQSHERVNRWLDEVAVPRFTPDALPHAQLTF